ncbi:sulfatase-like hydrolase/transferase [Actinomyces faecalis]|uniref:sulfatase-like hydrolase/transferase n=1 Tax=Actinomyces faecalis TaxID=2722820 RepID=UPI0015518C29|nr:sulfatase-like hydrolase/transferase [Actinomyces faecalis]
MTPAEPLSPVPGDGPRRPSFLFILTDDQGPWAVPWRMPELQMPHLAQLAREGIIFDSFYCTSPVCSPARASLLTGRMPSAHGIHDWLVGTEHPQAHPDQYLEDITTLPAVLSGAGYVCALSGKWHVGEARQPATGFSSWYAHRFGGGPYYEAPIWQEGRQDSESEYFTDAVGQHAVDFLRAHARERSEGMEGHRPFYLQVCPTAPHTPWDEDNHPRQLLDLYEDCDFPSVPREPAHPWTRARKEDFADSFAEPESSLRGYCAALSGVDQIVGRLRRELEDLGLAEETIILYMSDNGFSCGHHGIWGKGNGTYPLNMWENSVAVPFVMYVPQRLRDWAGAAGLPGAGSHVTDSLSALSFFPTVCELAGVMAPTDPLRAGESFLPWLSEDGQEKSSHQPVVVYDEYGGTRMIRDGRWKYVRRFEGPEELYDLQRDPQERYDLAQDPSLAPTRQRLRDQLEDWFARHETQRSRAYEQPVTGRGQIHPTWRREEVQRYVPFTEES